MLCVFVYWVLAMVHTMIDTICICIYNVSASNSLTWMFMCLHDLFFHCALPPPPLPCVMTFFSCFVGWWHHHSTTRKMVCMLLVCGVSRVYSNKRIPHYDCTLAFFFLAAIFRMATMRDYIYLYIIYVRVKHVFEYENACLVVNRIDTRLTGTKTRTV